MKNNILFILYIILYVSHNWTYYVTPANDRVWNNLSNTDLIIDDIESKICSMNTAIALDFNGVFTTLDFIQLKYDAIDNTSLSVISLIDTIASPLLSSIDSKVDLIDMNACQISDDITVLQDNDFGGTWTAIQSIKDNTCSLFNQIFNDTSSIKMMLDLIAGIQLSGFLGTCTMIEAISASVMSNVEELQGITESLDITSISSCIDMIMSINRTIKSDLDIIATIQTVDFSGTYTVLKELSSKICLIDQNIQAIEDLSFHISTFDQLDTKIEQIGTVLDVITNVFYSTCDTLQTIESLLNIVENKQSVIDTVADATLMASDASIATADSVAEKNITVESKVDVIFTLNSLIEDTLCDIESSLDITFNEVLSLESKIDLGAMISASVESVIDVHSSISDIVLDNSCTIESAIDYIDQSYRTIQSKIDLYKPLESNIDFLYTSGISFLDKTCTIESKFDDLNQHIYQTNSLVDLMVTDLDDLNINMQSVNSIVDILSLSSFTMYSSVATLDSISDMISSKVCMIESVADHVNSNIDGVYNAMSTVTSNLNILDAYFQQTWTILDTTQENSDTINSLLITIESKIDAIDGSAVTVDFSTVYTALQAIEQTELLTDSVLDGIALQATDVSGTYSVLNIIASKSSAMIESVKDFNSDLISYGRSECIGTQITSALIGTTGYTISRSGRYFFGANINFVPTAAATMITINASNVVLDFCGRTLSHTAATAFTVTGVSVSGTASNVIIQNGVISQMDGNNISIASGASNVAIQNMRIVDAESNGIDCVGTVTDLMIDDVIISGCGAKGISIINGIDVVLKRLMIVSNTGDGITINPGSNTIENLVIEKSIIARNSGNGISIAGTTGQRSSILIHSCHITANSLAGISASKTINSSFKNNMISSNGSNGIILSDAVSSLEIYDNAIINNTGRGIYVSGTNALSSSFQRNVMVVNTVNNYREDTDCGAHTVLSNYALATSEANNYSIGGGSDPTTINKAIINQGVGTFSTIPGKWRNISMTT